MFTEKFHAKVPDFTKGSDKSDLSKYISWCFDIFSKWMQYQLDNLHEKINQNHTENIKKSDEILLKISEKPWEDLIRLKFWVIYDVRNSIIFYNKKAYDLKTTKSGKIIKILLDNRYRDLTADFMEEELKKIWIDLQKMIREKKTKRDSVTKILDDDWTNLVRSNYKFLFHPDGIIKESNPILNFRCNL